MELASSGENGSKFWSCVLVSCCELSDVNSFALHSCEKFVFAIVTLTPSYSHLVPMAGSTGSKSEIAKFCMMERKLSSAASTACTWWICASVSIFSWSS